MSHLYVGLVHHPVNNKKSEVVATSVTNLDIHDIARSCRTFGVKRYFIITPIALQQELVERILSHWKKDESALYNPDRKDALSFILLADSWEKASDKIFEIEGVRPQIVVTGANFKNFDGTTKELKNQMNLDKIPRLLLFGTGWGLHASIVECADFRLRPLNGLAEDGYNHLSVRSAVAIYLDRLQGSL